MERLRSDRWASDPKQTASDCSQASATAASRRENPRRRTRRFQNSGWPVAIHFNLYGSSGMIRILLNKFGGEAELLQAMNRFSTEIILA